MIYHILFWTVCAVLAAHVAVAIIAIAKAYRDERRLALLNGTKRGPILSWSSTGSPGVGPAGPPGTR